MDTLLNLGDQYVTCRYVWHCRRGAVLFALSLLPTEYMYSFHTTLRFPTSRKVLCASVQQWSACFSLPLGGTILQRIRLCSLVLQWCHTYWTTWENTAKGFRRCRSWPGFRTDVVCFVVRPLGMENIFCSHAYIISVARPLRPTE